MMKPTDRLTAEAQRLEESAGRKTLSAAEFLKAHRLDGAVLGS